MKKIILSLLLVMFIIPTLSGLETESENIPVEQETESNNQNITETENKEVEEGPITPDFRT